MRQAIQYDLKKILNKCNIIVLVFLFYGSLCCAQLSSDSVATKSRPDSIQATKSTSDTSAQKIKHHSANKALLLSAVLPGLGQAYNKKYWKIPIVYAGIASLGYLIYYQNSRYQGYRNAYIYQVDGNPYTLGVYNGSSNPTSLETGKNFYRRNLDLACVGMFVWYALNLVDATVDGHLYSFDVSDKLTMKLQPDFNFMALTNGGKAMSVGIKFQVKL